MNDITGRQRQAETFNQAQSSAGLRCSKSLSPTHRERDSHYCANNEPKCSNGYLLDIYPFVLVYRIGSYFFCVKQTKVLALKNTIKDPYRSAVSGKRIEAERQMIEIESSSPYVLSSCLKVSQYFSLFPISQQCDGFFNRLNIGKKKCYTMSRNQRQSPPPPLIKRKKNMKFF